MKKLVLSLLLVSNVSLAAQVEDVNILDVKSGQDLVELKLQTKYEGKETQFFVEVMKNDAGSFEKLSHVAKKLAHGKQYKLDLDIISFSPSPSGSRYRSNDIMFSSPSEKAKTPSKTK